MTRQYFEAFLGVLVLLITVSFGLFTYYNVLKAPGHTYELRARFSSVNGLVEGSTVNMSGIKIGTVKTLSLNIKNYMAEAVLEIDKNVSIPKDSRASIVSAGLLGNKFLSISPGSEEAHLKAGEYFEETDGPVNLEGLLSQFVFKSGS